MVGDRTIITKPTIYEPENDNTHYCDHLLSKDKRITRTQSELKLKHPRTGSTVKKIYS